jgi:hypothetical protein
MAKKSFADNPALAFISTQRIEELPKTQGEQASKPTYYRLNLKLRGEYRQYLDDESWKARKSITEYLNDLIAADMKAKKSDGADV